AFHNKCDSWEEQRPSCFKPLNPIIRYFQVSIFWLYCSFLRPVQGFVALKIKSTAKDTLMEETCHKSIIHRSVSPLMSSLKVSFKYSAARRHSSIRSRKISK